MDPALATSLVRSALYEFGYLYPIYLFAGGWNGDNDERGRKGEVGKDRQYELTALMRTSSSEAVHLRSMKSCERRGGGLRAKTRANLDPLASSGPVV